MRPYSATVAVDEQHRQSAAAGSLNAFLNGAYAGGAMVGGHLREGGGGSVRGGSSVGGGVDGGGGGGVSVLGGGVDAPPLRQLDGPLRQLIETKERELHEIHDFRIRCACAVLPVWSPFLALCVDVQQAGTAVQCRCQGMDGAASWCCVLLM